MRVSSQEVLSTVLGDGVAFASGFNDIFDEHEEMDRRMLPGAARSRQDEFAAGRACARRALRRLGIDSGPIAKRRSGQPVWPAGVVGSITHCEGFRGAAVADDRALVGLGIDVERADAVDESILSVIASESEYESVNQLGYPFSTVLFSAKESFYKASAEAGIALSGFDSAHVSVSRDGTFRASWQCEGKTAEEARGTIGRWALTGPFVSTSVLLPR